MKLRNGKETGILEEKHPYFHSLLRKWEHLIKFGVAPATIKELPLLCTTSLRDYSNIKHALLAARASDAPIIPKTVDHWTSERNFASIVKKGGFLGHLALKRQRISFDANVFSLSDSHNLDSNVICFCPNMVDPDAIIDIDYHDLKDKLLVLRINTDAMQKSGKYNFFFKIIDLCSQFFTKTIHLSKSNTISIYRDSRCILGDAFYVAFTIGSLKHEVMFSTRECLFYGNLFEIRQFCLQILFTAIDKLPADHAKRMYTILERESVEFLEDLIVTFARHVISVSELNVRGHLPLTPHLIQNVHFTETNKTFTLNQLTKHKYQDDLLRVSNSNYVRHLDLTDETVYVETEVNYRIYDIPLAGSETPNITWLTYQFPDDRHLLKETADSEIQEGESQARSPGSVKLR